MVESHIRRITIPSPSPPPPPGYIIPVFWSNQTSLGARSRVGRKQREVRLVLAITKRNKDDDKQTWERRSEREGEGGKEGTRNWDGSGFLRREEAEENGKGTRAAGKEGEARRERRRDATPRGEGGAGGAEKRARTRWRESERRRRSRSTEGGSIPHQHEIVTVQRGFTAHRRSPPPPHSPHNDGVVCLSASCTLTTTSTLTSGPPSRHRLPRSSPLFLLPTPPSFRAEPSRGRPPLLPPVLHASNARHELNYTRSDSLCHRGHARLLPRRTIATAVRGQTTPPLDFFTFCSPPNFGCSENDSTAFHEKGGS